MKNIEYYASNIVWDLITNPKQKIYIAHKPLADMVQKMLREMIK